MTFRIIFISIFLIIHDVHCQITAPPEADNERKVIVPPLIYLQPFSNLTFVIGESIEMPCVSTGVPEPRYRWEYNDKDFDPSGLDGRVAIQPGRGTLIFADPQKRDEGVYQCFATNQGGVSVSIKIYLRRAILDSFVERPLQTLRPNYGSHVKLGCIPPRAYPKADIFWAYVKEGSLFDPIEFNQRITMDPDGNLFILKVEKIDNNNDQIYACMVQNKIMREIRQGYYYKLLPTGSTETYSKPSILYHHPHTQVALRGGVWQVKCIFGGNPLPHVNWDRQPQGLSPRTTMASFGQALIITDVQFDDEGNYECSGQNVNSPKPERFSFNLKVESAPYWVQQLESRDVAENETVEFTCIGNGKPSVENFWFINGKPISEAKPNPNRQLLGNKMIFRNVRKEDVQVIQCNVTNTHGYVFANAYLNVQVEPPIIRRAPKVGFKAAEGQTVNLTCEVFGSPKPLVIWYKGNEQLTGGRFEIMPEGHLQISDVSLVDAGQYECTAVNMLGNDSAIGSLIVRRRTMILTAPLDIAVYEGTEAKFTCTATTDSEEIHNLDLRWKKDNEFIDFNEAQRMFKNTMDNSLTISGTIWMDTSKYGCYATNGLDFDEASAQLVVQGVPDAPRDVKVLCTSQVQNLKFNQVLVSWQSMKENYAPILNFIVQYNTSFTPDNWVTINSNISQTDNQIKVMLSPWSNYTFRVLARNKIGTSFPSKHSLETCLTEEDVPRMNPENVIGEGDAPNNLIVYWTPMPQIEHNGQDFHYHIQAQRADIANAPIVKYNLNEWWENHFRIGDNLQSYVPYNITVRAVNRKGNCPLDAKVVVGYTGEEKPTITVKDIRVDEADVKDTTAILEWDQVDTNPDNIKGFFRGYRVQFWKKNDKDSTIREQDFILREPENPIQPRPRGQQLTNRVKRDLDPIVKVTLTHLLPNTDIVAHVLILNRYYSSNPSSETTFHTKPGKPGPPATFEVAVRGATHFELRWTPPREPNGVIVGYNISYQIVSDLNLGRLTFRQPITNPNLNYARLTGLSPKTNYRIYLQGVTQQGRGDPIFLDEYTISSVRPHPPTFIVTDVGNTWVNITFEPSRIGNPGSVFYPQYRQRGLYHWTHSPDETIGFTAFIGSLEPGTTYQIRMMAKNGVSFESPSEYQEFRTNGDTIGKASPNQGWHIGMWVGLILLVILVVVFIVIRIYRETWWEEKENEIEEEVRALQARQAAEDINRGVTNQYVEGVSHDYDDQSYRSFPDTPVSNYGPREFFPPDNAQPQVHQSKVEPESKNTTFV